MLSYSEIINPSDHRVKRILQVEEKHFSKGEFRKSSISEICKDAGISKPTFYRYFDKKETLLFAAIIFSLRHWYEAYLERVKEIDTATGKLRLYLELSEEFVRSTPLFTKTFSQNPELRRSWSVHPLSTEAYLYNVDFVEKIILEGIASDEFRVRDTRRTGHIIVLASTLFLIFEPEMPAAPTQSRARFLFDILENGIVKRKD